MRQCLFQPSLTLSKLFNFKPVRLSVIFQRDIYKRDQSQKGFTLIELLVAIVLFAMLMVMAFEGMSFVVDRFERNKEYFSTDGQLGKAVAVISQDIFHMRPQTINDPLGGTLNAYTTESPEFIVELTRGGLPQLHGGVSGGFQRVAYSVNEDGELIRWTWPLLNSFIQQTPQPSILLTDVEAVEFHQLDLNFNYTPNWPPLSQAVPLNGLPKMVRIKVLLKDGLTYERLLPGLEN